ncbi:MAG: hypothetical protein R3346_03310 [Candidatus Spechtbacterales bacterium]|nr:hypothetical protein [Candidatus Spechtbacterales bacterium]
MKILLFICSAASHRSVTAARLFEDSKKYKARFAGTNLHAKVKLTQDFDHW